MKKVAIISLAAMMAVGFAFEPKFDATLVQGISGGVGSAYDQGKSRLNLSGKVSDVTSVVYQLDVAGDMNSNSAMKLFYVDTKAFGLSWRFGSQVFSPTNLFGGLYQDSVFYAKTKLAIDPGVGVFANVAGIDLYAAACGGIDQASNKYGVKASAKVSDYKVSAFVSKQSGSDAKLALEVQGKVAGIDAYAQGQAALVAAGASTDLLPGVTGYVDASIALDNSTVSGANQSLWNVGAKTALNSDVTVGAELQLGNVSSTTFFGVQLKI